MIVEFNKLKWTKDADCQVCERKLPSGYHGYIGTGPGLHVVVVTWEFDGVRGADGAITHMWRGEVIRFTPDEALSAAEAARAAVAKGQTHDGDEGEGPSC